MNLFFAAAGLVLTGLLLIIAILIRVQTIMQDSLPVLDGETVSDILINGESVRIETDAQGVPRIIARSNDLVLFGLGYAHARDRYFQMDLGRRFAAGELAGLLGGGKSLIENDKKVRRHQFRKLCRDVVAGLPENDRRNLEKYTAGVNQALNELKRMPWEYSLLKTRPVQWLPEDTLLVSQSIYLFLEGNDLAFHQANDLIHECLPPKLAEFLTPKGGAWDSPIAGDAFIPPDIPDATDFNLYGPNLNFADYIPESWDRLENKVLGSNAWLVSGRRIHGESSGPALVANDMHLSLGLPPTWYKVSLVIQDHDGEIQSEVHGVTLPGGPPVVSGSNGKIAWGLTSAQGDWGDLLILETDPNHPRKYKTPDGWQEMQQIVETIAVRGGPDITVQIDWTIWGPVVDEDIQGRKRVWRWVAQELDGVNLNIVGLTKCQSVESALELVATCGVPHVNFLVGDTDGHIGWTIMGRLPRRVGAGIVDERLPMMAADRLSQWDGYLEPNEYPKVIDPPDGLIWSANHRMVDGEMLNKVGLGRYDRGVRATRIRQLLQSSENYDEQKMLEIQMDHHALLLMQWRDLILSELPPDLAARRSDRISFLNMIQSWNGDADADSKACALLTECRLRIVSEVISPLVQPIKQAESGRSKPAFYLRQISLETPAWSLLKSRPAHLLSPKYQSWSELIIDCIDETIKHARETGWPTWGEVNRLVLSHPFGNKIAILRPWLSAPVIYSSGALTDTPLIQSPVFGASQRLSAFPGRESNAIMQLPGGQCGHPLSPHFYDLLHDWTTSGPTPLASGPAVHVFTIKSQADQC